MITYAMDIPACGSDDVEGKLKQLLLGLIIKQGGVVHLEHYDVQPDRPGKLEIAVTSGGRTMISATRRVEGYLDPR